MADQLIIRGAREHNLKDVSLDLPRDSLIVFTGLSGSGKSSLAFDTIFAEGQRRYVESLSAYARQFLGQMDKPDVDFIEGLSPAVSIDQKSTSKNPRSTVGTITEVYDYLRLLYARAGRPHCPTCGAPISRQTPQQIVDRILALEEGARFQVLAPVIRGRKGEYVDLFRQLQAQGFSRARVNGETYPLTEPPKLDKQKKHTIEVVVDRLAVKPSSKQRLTASVEIIIEEGASSFVAGLGVPMPIMERLKKAGLKVMVVCGAVKHAVKAEQAGCDAVICQGGEGGGHTGLVGTLPLVAQAVEAVKIPVVAAGGLYDGRGLAAALSLGAVGVWMGTRFIASQEAHAGQMYRDVIVEATDEDTVRTRSYSGKPMRVKKNAWVDDWEKRPQDIQPFPQQAMLSSRSGAMGGIGGQTENLDIDKSAFAMGQSAGGIREVLPAGEIVKRIMAEAETAIDRVAAIRKGAAVPA